MLSTTRDIMIFNHFYRFIAAAILVILIGTTTPMTLPLNADARRASGVCATPIEEHNRATLEAYTTALTSGNVEQALSYWAEGATVTVYGSIPYAGSYSATDGSYGQAVTTYWVDNRTGEFPPTLYADCNQVILRGRWVATGSSTGIVVDQEIIEIFNFNANGRMMSDDFYFTDTVAVSNAITSQP
jgi:hypothetical protein